MYQIFSFATLGLILVVNQNKTIKWSFSPIYLTNEKKIMMLPMMK